MSGISRLYRFSGRLLIAGSLILSTVSAADEQSTENSTMAVEGGAESSVIETSTIGRSTNVESKLSAEFSDFLGSEERAADVVEGLRTGEEFRLSDYEADQSEVTSSASSTAQQDAGMPGSDFSIDPPTDSMGYGNVRLTMKLAEAHLQKLGIDQPTNEQLSAVLVGGEIDGMQLEGILNERAAGAGWGEIAKRYDFRVGELMGKAPARTHPVSVDQSTQQDGVTDSTQNKGYIPSGKAKYTHAGDSRGGPVRNTKSQGAKANGYVPRRSSPLATAGGHGVSKADHAKGNGAKKNGYIPSGKSNATRAGIVSATGASTASMAKTGNGHGKGGHAKGYVPSGAGQGAGVLSAGNLSTGATVSAASGQGHGKGHAKGHGKHK